MPKNLTEKLNYHASSSPSSSPHPHTDFIDLKSKVKKSECTEYSSQSHLPSSEALRDMCYYCFDVLVEALKATKMTGDSAYGFDGLDEEEFPMFISWKFETETHQDKDDDNHFITITREKNEGHSERTSDLRGCIGTFKPFSLKEGLKTYALLSALGDRRFSPMTEIDLKPNLSCTVSLLIQFEKARSWNDWIVGTHGITIDFIDPSDSIGKSATFLPEVAEENHWNHLETIEHLVRKATGHHALSKKLSREFLKNLNVERYQSLKCTVTLNEYILSRKHHQSQ